MEKISFLSGIRTIKNEGKQCPIHPEKSFFDWNNISLNQICALLYGQRKVSSKEISWLLFFSLN